MIPAITYRRAAEPDDAARIARLFRAVREACLPYLPRLHTPEEDLGYFSGHVLTSSTVWIAEADGQIAGFAAFGAGSLDHLYVDPQFHRCGIGTALLDIARSAEDRLELWVFARNQAARRFYERHGFRLVEETDGSGNEEGEPDARYRWERGTPA